MQFKISWMATNCNKAAIVVKQISVERVEEDYRFRNFRTSGGTVSRLRDE
jgi:hypothetical protein